MVSDTAAPEIFLHLIPNIQVRYNTWFDIYTYTQFILLFYFLKYFIEISSFFNTCSNWPHYTNIQISTSMDLKDP